MADPTLRVLSLFSGFGGLDLGVSRAARRLGLRSRCVGYIEREAFAAAVLVAAMDRGELDAAPVFVGDVRDFDAAAWRGAVDLVLAGFPCPAVSTVGKRRGRADERWLWPEVVRVVRETGARWVFAENVPGLLTANAGEALAEIAHDLAEMGVAAEWAVVAAAEVGAPHRRERWFSLGHAEDADRRTGGEAGPEGSRQRRRGPGGTDDALADAIRIPSGERPERQRVRAGGGTLADPGSDRWRKGARALSRRQPVAADGGEAVADPDRDRPQGLGAAGPETRSVGGSLGAFPPGPADFDAWRSVLAVRPDLAPALEPGVRPLADGTAGAVVRVCDCPRADLLRGYGNAVVPEQAAAVFLELWRRLR